jgi:hypothetical protein
MDVNEEVVFGSATRVQVALLVEKYIGQPFWPETSALINIGKDVHPKLGDAKKEAAINAALEKRDLNRGDYDRMVLRAARPFYTATDANDGSGEIIIPERIIQSFINHASQKAPKAIPRVAEKGLTFIGVKIAGGALLTGRTLADALKFERFVKNEESNQRMFCSQSYIANFTARGVFHVDEDIIKVDALRRLFEYGGRYFGIGSARPQGYGRFTVTGWDVL